MDAETPADPDTADPQTLANAVALLERVGDASLEEARAQRRARAEGSVEAILGSARARAAHILSSITTSVTQATDSEVLTTEDAFTDFSRELVRVRESVGRSRDAVVVSLDPAATAAELALLDLPVVPPPPIAVAPVVEQHAPPSAAGTYFALLHSMPSLEPEPEPEPEALEAPRAAVPAWVADPVKPHLDIPWFLDPPPPRVAAPERVEAAPAAAIAGPEVAEPVVAEPVVAEPEVEVDVPKPRYEVAWFLNPPPPLSTTLRTTPSPPPSPTPPAPPAPKPAAPVSGDLLAPPPADAKPVDLPPPASVSAAPAPAAAPSPAELMPEARTASRSRLRRMFSRLFRNVGILLIAFAVLQLWGTGLLQSRSQHDLRTEFRQAVSKAHAQQTRAAALVVAGADTTVRQVIPPAPKTGDPVARLRIPAIGVDQIVVEGTDVAELRRGPGHDASTPLPGDAGDSMITGHRTAYGGPFNHLDELKVGDTISVTTPTGASTYLVSDSPRAVPSGAGALPTGEDRLILTTSQPKYKASGALAVFARLRNPPAGAARPVSDSRAAAIAVGGFGWFGSSAGALILLWGVLMLGVYLAMYRLADRWHRSRLMVFTLAAIPLAVTAFLFLQAVGRVFPANY